MIELNGIQLDKTSAVPLYEQLRKALLEAITSGKLSAGTKLPTEEELRPVRHFAPCCTAGLQYAD